ncbi:MAG: hypothetical protein JNL10_21555 [Verrucomicrobiales bacterium]|nr:hypothetical protein [Verrucomicrobiales bacterium]
MPPFCFFKSSAPAASGSHAWQAFQQSFLADAANSEQVRSGPDLGVFERLTPDERGAAERMLIERLARADDSRAAIGLAAMQSRAAVEPLRHALRAQAGRGSMASPAFAHALWTLTRDPAAIEAVLAIARDAAVQETMRMEAVLALAGMPSPAVVQSLYELVQQEKAYLLRYHAFKGLLMLHGYTRQQADALVGPIAPQIAGAAVRAEAREAVLSRLASLLAGRTLIAPP